MLMKSIVNIFNDEYIIIRANIYMNYITYTSLIDIEKLGVTIITIYHYSIKAVAFV